MFAIIINLGSGSVSISCPICDETHAAVVSSIAVAILTSVLFFTIGFLSGYFTLKCRYKHTSSTIATYEQPDGQPNQGHTQDQPLYEAIPGVENQNIELEENAAYSASAVHSNDHQELEMGENIAYVSVHDEDWILVLILYMVDIRSLILSHYYFNYANWAHQEHCIKFVDYTNCVHYYDVMQLQFAYMQLYHLCGACSGLPQFIIPTLTL